MFRKTTAAVLCAVLGITLCGCGRHESSAPPVSSPYKTVSLSSDGTLEISRKEIGSTPMGEDGTWTIYVYMSGSNLESTSGKATEDMNEMLAASTGKNVRFIIQTGGSTKWKNDYADKEKLGRFEISDGELKTLDELPSASMADASTLRNFLKWGVKKYPAAKMGVIFWGHGKGSLGGVCKDNLFDGDYLTLAEIQAAFDEVTASMTDKFEFVGFDACYMGTVEAADMLATYSRYMIGSEEFEPANGWDYTVLGDLLGSDPGADWKTIAGTLCDGFIDNVGDSEYADRVTLSVTDLSKIDDVAVKLNNLAGDLCEALTDKARLREFEDSLEDSEHFSNENAFSGYANTADLADLAKAGEKFSDKAGSLIAAIDDAVVYKHNAVLHPNACGLTVCYPFEPGGLAEMRVFSEFVVSPYYLALTDIVLKNASPAADLSDYDKSVIAALWCDGKNGSTQGLHDYWSSEPDPGRNKNGSGKSTLVSFPEGFEVTHDGTYSLSLDPKTLPNVVSVGINVYMNKPKYEYYGLGTMISADADWKTGVFSDTFDGRWYLLPNREPIEIKPLDTADGAVNYDAQIKLPDMETVLTFSHGDRNRSPAIIGHRHGNADGTSVFAPTQSGDTVAAFYDVFTHSNDKYDTAEGTAHTFTGEPSLLFDTLNDGKYYYMIVVTDILGDKLQSEIVDLYIVNGKPDYSGQPAENS